MCIVPVRALRASIQYDLLAFRSTISARRTVAATTSSGDVVEVADDSRNTRGTRPRGSRIEVWGSPEERAAIAAKAGQSGLSQSAFLRAVGLNQPVRWIYDLKAAADLIRVNGDAGRLAGLLKNWMTDHLGGGPPQEIEAMVQDLQALQDEMQRIAGCVIRCERASRATLLRDR